VTHDNGGVRADGLSRIAQYTPPTAHACRDLKPENFLLAFSPTGYPLLRLCDLGSARKVRGTWTEPASQLHTRRAHRIEIVHAGTLLINGSNCPPGYVLSSQHTAGATVPPLPSTPYICTRAYRAPELLCGSTLAGAPVDVWSLACCIGEHRSAQRVKPHLR